MSKDGVKRWLDNDQPCSGTQCFDCEFVISKKQHDEREAKELLDEADSK